MILGQSLLEDGIITQKQLNDALKIQKEDGTLLGLILVKSKTITEDILVKHLSLQIER